MGSSGSSMAHLPEFIAGIKTGKRPNCPASLQPTTSRGQGKNRISADRVERTGGEGHDLPTWSVDRSERGSYLRDVFIGGPMPKPMPAVPLQQLSDALAE